MGSTGSATEFCRRMKIARLLEEEKWLAEAQADIIQQINCLRIERLHIEALKANLLYKGSLSGVKAMQLKLSSKSSSNSDDSDEPSVDSESDCSDEELDSGVIKSIFEGQAEDYNMEEYDDEEEDVSSENEIPDINMVTNGAAENDSAGLDAAEASTSAQVPPM